MLASLITMFSALLFSFPADDTERKSFVKNVPIPNEPVTDPIRQSVVVARGD